MHDSAGHAQADSDDKASCELQPRRCILQMTFLLLGLQSVVVPAGMIREVLLSSNLNV